MPGIGGIAAHHLIRIGTQCRQNDSRPPDHSSGVENHSFKAFVKRVNAWSFCKNLPFGVEFIILPTCAPIYVMGKGGS